MEPDLDEFTEDCSCPYCGCERFLNDHQLTEGNDVLNTCMECGKQSIWRDEKQYKIK